MMDSTAKNRIRTAPKAETALPVIDIGPLLTGDPTRCAALAAQLRQASSETGFFYIANHGIAEEEVASIFREARRFFDEPADRKARMDIRNTPNFRGYDGVGSEALDAAAGGDMKESMYMGVDLGPDHPLVRAGTPHHGANQWPDWLDGWKESVQGYFARMEQLSFLLLNGLALSLDLPWGYFDFGLPDAMTSLRLLRYPPQPDAAEAGRIGAGAHTDWGVLTILAQDSIGGLQIRLRSGRWIDASPIPGTFIVNIGDMMARWTNDLYASTEHRVLNRSPQARHSVAFFMDTSYNTLVECLPTCCGPDDPPRYPPILAGDHLIEMKHRSYGYTG